MVFREVAGPIEPLRNCDLTEASLRGAIPDHCNKKWKGQCSHKFHYAKQGYRIV